MKEPESTTAAPTAVVPSRRSRRLALRREVLRDSLWPDARKLVWSRRTAKGFTTLPRTLPLIMRLLGDLTVKGDPSRVYMDLWFRAFDEGLVIVHDEDEMAFTCGYDGPRATRTWREHINAIAKLGFIRTKEMGNRDVGHVLLLDPHPVVAALRGRGKIRDEWWSAFVLRVHEIGGDVPNVTDESDGKHRRK